MIFSLSPITNVPSTHPTKPPANDFPLIVAAGVTVENVKEQLKICDAAIVGSYFKDTRKDTGDVKSEHVREFMDVVKELRSEN